MSHPFKHNLYTQKYKGIHYTVLVVKVCIVACVFNKQINARINYVSDSIIFWSSITSKTGHAHIIALWRNSLYALVVFAGLSLNFVTTKINCMYYCSQKKCEYCNKLLILYFKGNQRSGCKLVSLQHL